jgi:folate-binding protein YgfZ
MERVEDAATGHGALETGAALVERPQVPLRLTGRKTVEMLNAVLTNDVPEAEGQGAYALLLDAKGRTQADLRALRTGSEGDVSILTEPEGAAALRTILGRYAPFSRVKLHELPGWTVLGLYGPNAGDLLGPRLAEHESAEVEVGGVGLLAVGVALPVPGYDLVGPAEAVVEARRHLSEAGAEVASAADYEAARVARGVPRFGADLGPENFPGEAGLLGRAVSLKKGCYPGQETVARMHYRGSPNKRLYMLRIAGPVPVAGAEISQSGKVVGRITSVSPLPDSGERLALGYLARSADRSGPLASGEARCEVLGEVQ